MGKVKVKIKSSKDKRPYDKGSKKTKKSSKSVTDASASADKDEDKEIVDELTIDIVKELGGTEDDLKLLAMETENFDGKNDDDLEEDAKSELQNLIKSLNFSKFTSDTFTVKDEEVESSASVKKDEKTDEKPVEKDADQAAKIQDDEISSSSDLATTPVPGNLKEESEAEENGEDGDQHKFSFLKVKIPDRKSCVIKSGGEKWFTNSQTEGEDNEPCNAYWLGKIEKYTKGIWDKEKENYTKSNQKGSKRSEAQWVQTVLKSGTLNDKFAAYVLLIQDSPVHNVSVIETLIDFVNLKSRRPCLMAIDNLQKLFLEVLLIPDRKLRNFEKNPFHNLSNISGGNKDTIDRYLISWMFEDTLKKLYFKFLDNLELVSKDSIDKTRIRSLSCVMEMIAGNPEQESLLLSRLVNKLGDPSRSVAAKAMYLLSQLLERHPVMKWVVVAEVERLLYRPNIATRAQYFGICFLSQIMLEKFNTDNLAAKLIKIYFSFFTVSVKKGEVDTKLMKALLTGVNRAFPYAVLDPAELDKQMETMHKLVHLVSFNISIQALTLLYQVMDSRDSVTDRFYSALYKKILDPELTTSSKQVMFLNLLYKAIKGDTSVPRVRAFMKRLLQVISYQPSHLVCGLLFLMSEITKGRPEIVSEIPKVESADSDDKFLDDDDDDLEHFKDVTEDGEEVEDPKTAMKVKSGWTFKGSSANREEKQDYDPNCRNPIYSGAEKCDYWELQSLSQHFHPSASLFANNILENDPIKYTGDPLSDFTLPRFLDRFVFRNPKKNPEKNKPSTILGKRNIYKPAGIKAIAPDSKEFLNRDAANVPTDELFIYKYFHEKLERKGAKTDDDVGSVTSEEFNDFLDNMGGKSTDFDDEDDLDFAGGLGEENVEEEAPEDDEEEQDLNMEASDDEDEPMGLDGEDDDNFKDLSSGEESGVGADSDNEFDEEGFGDEDLDFDEEGFGDEPAESKMNLKKSKKVKTKFAKFDPNDLSSILADAEEFSHLIEDNDDDDAGTSSSVATRDKAGKKQLSWEKNNHDFMKGKNWKNKKSFSSKPKKGQNFKSNKKSRK